MKLLRRLALAAALPLLPAAAAAQCGGSSLVDRLTPDQRQAVAGAAAVMPYPEGIVWEATRGAARVVLVGTLHVWDPRTEALAAEVSVHLDGARRALFEMTAAEQAELMEAITADPSLTTITAGPTLPELLDPATWAQLSETASEHGIPGFVAAKMQPWFLATMLGVPACAMQAMAEGRQGLDFLLMDAAAARGVPVAALEPWDTLFSLFEGLTMEDQIDLLRMSLIAPELQDEMFVAMLDGYFDGRIGEIWELNRVAIDLMPGMEGAADFLDEAEERLLADRNRAWVPVIEAAAEEAAGGTVVVAAGAAHLPGEDGVLNLLAANGWALRRLDG